MLTMQEINAMSPEELEAKNKELSLKLGKLFLKRMFISTVIVVGTHYVFKKLDEK